MKKDKIEENNGEEKLSKLSVVKTDRFRTAWFIEHKSIYLFYLFVYLLIISSSSTGILPFLIVSDNSASLSPNNAINIQVIPRWFTLKLLESSIALFECIFTIISQL